MVGGLLLIGVMAMTVISVLGRYLFNAPIPGDYEITELACGIAVFTFFARCHVKNANIVVGFFTGRMRTRYQDGTGRDPQSGVLGSGGTDHLAPLRRRNAQA